MRTSKKWAVLALAPLALMIGAASVGDSPKVLTFDKSARVDYERLSLYRLAGDSYEIGRAAGALTPPEAFTRGMIPYMANFVNATVDQADVIKGNTWLKPVIGAYLDMKYYNSFKHRLRSDENDFLRGLHDSTGLPVGFVRVAMMNPDISHLLISDYLQGHFFFGIGAPSPAHPHLHIHPTLPMGCSTLVVPPSRSADGKMIFTRVQDYPGVGRYDAFPSIYYVAKPGRYRYVTVSTGGVAIGGITAMNEFGLTLSVHSGLSYDTDIHGYPVISVTGRMMETARTIEEAVDICNQYVPAAGWLMNLADVKNGVARSARIEVNPKDHRCYVDFQPDFLMTTNDYFRPHDLQDEVRTGPSFDSDGANRLERLQELVAESGPKISVERTMQIMADRKDPEMNRYMSYAPGGVAALHQIAAVVFRPETRELWVSNGFSPPAANGSYIHFDFNEFDDLENLASHPRPADIDIHELLKGTPNDISDKPAYFAFREAYRLYDSNGVKDPAAALNMVNLATQFEPDEPFYLLARGMLELHQDETLEGVQDLASVSQNPLLNQHRRDVAELYEAEGLDVLGRRSDAIRIYSALAIDGNVYDGIRAAAEARLLKAAKASDLHGIDPDLRFADTTNYN